MRTVKLATLVIAASATLFACKPKEETSAPVTGEVTEESAQEESAPVAAVDRREACNLTLTVPENADWTTYWEPSGGGGNGAKSVHWANDTEKAAQASNFLAVPLEITCSSNESPSVSITLSAQNSTESDVPMGPGSYPIWGREQSVVKGGQFLTASLMSNGRVFDSRSGTITISEFSTEGVKGSFTLDGAEMNSEEAAPIHLEGTFEFPCRGGLMESACTASQN
jgi:hypothetical protein